MASKVIHLTEAGLQKIKNELDHLRSVERPAISAAIAEARDKGDLSENAEYDAAKEAQGMLEMRIAKLEEMVANARVIDESRIDTSSVQILTRVTLKNMKTGKNVENELFKLELLLNQAGLAVGDRAVEKQAHAVSERTGGAPAAAIELPDGTVVTGKNGPLLGAASSALLNALKKLAGIDHEIDLVSARAIEPIQTLKTNYLGSRNPRLHTDEILIALSSSAAENETAAVALQQLSKLKGCDMHSTVILSSVDTDTIKRLGMYLTCEPAYEQEDRKYHKK